MPVRIGRPRLPASPGPGMLFAIQYDTDALLTLYVRDSLRIVAVPNSVTLHIPEFMVVVSILVGGHSQTHEYALRRSIIDYDARRLWGKLDEYDAYREDVQRYEVYRQGLRDRPAGPGPQG